MYASLRSVYRGRCPAILMTAIVVASIVGCQPAAPATSSSPPTNDTPSEAKSSSPSDGAPNQSLDVSQNANGPDSQQSVALLSEQELADGWIALFDGRTMFGWQPNSDANWRVENGSIVVDSGSPGLLCTTAEFSDYVLKCEFRAPTATNSGIFLHTPDKPTDPAKDCYELNIAPPDNPFPTGSLVKRSKVEGTFTSEDWQSFEVTVQGGRVQVGLNGKQVLEYTDANPLGRGHIGLQLNQGKVEFRSIRLKPLNTASLFNGRDLMDWKEYPELASKFTVTPEGWIHVKDGRGQLETKKSYGDFVLQIECISHAKNLNSGVFFRCIPGELMNGYECQIHNGFQDGDRTKPVDCGTGGIFRRQNARRVVSNDQEWFHMTLIADENHMAAWVNGYQVSDWKDERAPHENPRNGRRDKPGTIMLQGHDPTTDLSFRNLRIAELTQRQEPK